MTSKLRELFVVLIWEESLEYDVINACHLLATNAVPRALCEILADSCKQRTTSTTWTAEDTCQFQEKVWHLVLLK